MCQYFLYYKALKAKQTRMSYNTTETNISRFSMRCEGNLFFNMKHACAFLTEMKTRKNIKVYFFVSKQKPAVYVQGMDVVVLVRHV